MYFAPLFFLGFGYWMASNKQMLSNDHLSSKERMSSSGETEHTVDRVFIGGEFMEAPAWPLLALFALLLLNQLFGALAMKCLGWCLPSLKLKIQDVDLDEDIDNYWAVLNEKDKNWAIKEDHYSTENLGLQILTKR